MPTATKGRVEASGPQPAWDIAMLFPNQGAWTVEEYLDVTRSTNRLVEYADGHVEVLPMPTLLHQLIVAFLLDALRTFVRPLKLGTVVFAGYKVSVTPTRFREPDILFVKREDRARMGQDYTDVTELAMEVVSDSNRDLDLVTKREEYARAGIPEYWIVDATEGRITVLVLRQGASEYVTHGEFPRGATATSVVLPGFTVDVSHALAPEE